MSERTSIEWCDSTINPTMGCSGCELWSHEDPKGNVCYAGHLVNRYGGRRGWPTSFAYVKEFHGRIAQACAWGDLRGKSRRAKPWLNARPRHIFVGDMGDLFDRHVSADFLRNEVLARILWTGKRHFWIFLTKRPGYFIEVERKMRALPGWPPDNIIVGTSVTSQTNQWRLAKLLTAPEDIPLFVSFEPLLGPVNIFRMLVGCSRRRPLEWLIVGGQSGPKATPLTPNLVRPLRDLAKNWQIPFFYKQTADRLKKVVSIPELDGEYWTEMPNLEGNAPCRIQKSH